MLTQLRIVGLGSYAMLTFHHADYAVNEVIVNTADNDPPTALLQALETTAVKPTFTHTLDQRGRSRVA